MYDFLLVLSLTLNSSLSLYLLHLLTPDGRRTILGMDEFQYLPRGVGAQLLIVRAVLQNSMLTVRDCSTRL